MIEKVPTERPEIEKQPSKPYDANRVLEDGFEKSIAPAANEMFQVADSIDKKINTTASELSPELKVRIDELSKKINRFVYRLIAIVGFVSTAAVLSSEKDKLDTGADYRRQFQTAAGHKIPDSVLERKGSAGIRFTHSDLTTTHILNYFAGRDTLSEKEVEMMFKNEWKKKIVEEIKIKVPDHFDSMSIDEVANFISLNYKIPQEDFDRFKILKEIDFRNIDKEVRLDMFKKFPRFLGERKGVYEALWRIEKANGAPKVRLMESDPKFEDTRLGYYYSETNTIVLSIDRLYDYKKGQNISANPELAGSMFGELAHAQQSKNPERRDSVFKEDLRKRELRAMALNISLDSAQKYEYPTKGSIKHEAHHIIEPYLKKYFQVLVKEFGQKGTKPQQ